MVMTKSHAFSVVSDEHAKKMDDKDFSIDHKQPSSEAEANKKKTEK
tara:strand:- start:4817 stop:4954 length:138 start_codon:yes stop_codon:yes gene_type:complete